MCTPTLTRRRARPVLDAGSPASPTGMAAAASTARSDVVVSVEPHERSVAREAEHVTADGKTSAEQGLERVRQHPVEHLDTLRAGARQRLGQPGEAGQIGENH